MDGKRAAIFRRPGRLLALLAFALSAAQALAQDEPPTLPPLPSVPTPTVPAGPASGPQTVLLSAVLTGDTKPIRTGLVWRIYRDNAGAQPELVAKLTAPAPATTLPPGNYIVHAAYGLASATKRITVSSGALREQLSINAGALKLGGMIAGVPIEPDRLEFSIYQPQQNNPEGRLVATNVRPGDLVRLPEGSYHIVSTYGESNAIMRADLKVDRGRITEATLNHRAATVTLKLVDTAGGEAFAGTAFSILTPGGDVVREAIGAFPQVVLAEGEYTLIARNNGKVYTRDFRVETGLNVDVEVLAGSG
ncbi:hypothetical protein [Enterovirga sp.]|uniref:hypothetical protein n=1 Tax=Enterovirga sp. TaxID=2026350 RepID=UPI002C637807|nr:hypothetical protein [Enterovirga sp.]HMO29806.1 hypothetical protein [Enterovirga sp.]